MSLHIRRSQLSRNADASLYYYTYNANLANSVRMRPDVHLAIDSKPVDADRDSTKRTLTFQLFTVRLMISEVWRMGSRKVEPNAESLGCSAVGR